MYAPAPRKYVLREVPDNPQNTCLALAPYLAAYHPNKLQPASIFSDTVYGFMYIRSY